MFRSWTELRCNAAPVAVAAALGGVLELLVPLPALEPGRTLARALPMLIAVLAGLATAVRMRQKQDAARDRQLGLEALMRSVQHGVVVFDERHHILEWSAGAADLFGYSQHEMVGASLDPLIAPSDRQKLAD